MSKVTPEEIEVHLREAVDDHIAKASKRWLSGSIHEWFNTRLDASSKDVAKIEEDLRAYTFDTGHPEHKPLIHIGDKLFVLNRLVGYKHTVDIHDIKTDTEKFINDVREATEAYVDTLPADTTHAADPLMYIKTEAYMVTWFLYGWYCTPWNENDQ